jgi:uncharacterized membrane protein
MATVEVRIRHAKPGLICVAIAAVGLVFSAMGVKVVAGYSFPRSLLLFSLLADIYGACFFLWLLRRLKKQQSAKQIANLVRQD